MSNFSNNLKYLRIAKGYTQQELADISGITQTSIGNYETRGRIPNDEIKHKLISALECTEEELFGYSDGAAGYEYSIQDFDKLTTFEDNNIQVPACYLKEGQLKLAESNMWEYCPPHIKSKHKNGFIYKLKDTSVNQSIPNGSNCFIAPFNALNLANNHICLVKYKNELILRYIRTIGNNLILEPKSFDNKYNKEFIDLDKDHTDFELYGRVIWFDHDAKGL